MITVRDVVLGIRFRVEKVVVMDLLVQGLIGAG